jgi:hypothetical protein
LALDPDEVGIVDIIVVPALIDVCPVECVYSFP